ncbi:hypothetical protein UY3_08501 [Chelonia mydas]|uniref:Uncharacterized protein n=1 Tax=Chelonia mydas TaxID=8469 RepID=M7C1R1_CHEMY|nr:hypothetical protein UY3_08501 [Chelonia mydas]
MYSPRCSKQCIRNLEGKPPKTSEALWDPISRGLTPAPHILPKVPPPLLAPLLLSLAGSSQGACLQDFPVENQAPGKSKWHLDTEAKNQTVQVEINHESLSNPNSVWHRDRFTPELESPDRGTESFRRPSSYLSERWICYSDGRTPAVGCSAARADAALLRHPW